MTSYLKVSGLNTTNCCPEDANTDRAGDAMMVDIDMLFSAALNDITRDTQLHRLFFYNTPKIHHHTTEQDTIDDSLTRLTGALPDITAKYQIAEDFIQKYSKQ